MPSKPTHQVSEYGGLDRAVLGARACRELQVHDTQHAARHGGEPVFDWSRLATVRAKSWVGVVETASVSVEILPKVAPGASHDGDRARRNLIVMLHGAGAIPSANRALAAIQHTNMSLLDVFAIAFGQALVSELERGPNRTYVRREENLRVLRGKLLAGRNALINHGLADRVYVEFDELVTDSPLNRVLRAACELLVRRVRSGVARDLLERSLLHLADVASVRIGSNELAAVHLDRGSERFRVVLDFARLVLGGDSPSQGRGDSRTFSILFPMERVFEAYVANLLIRHASDLGLGDCRVRAQAGGRCLALNESNQGVLLLRPDVLIENAAHQPICILDTKWKTLLADDEDRRNGVSRDDLYQLFAYATRFSCRRNILLYPKVACVTPRRLRIPGTDETLEIAMIDLGRDLQRERRAVVEELARLVGGRQEPERGVRVA